ncbi:hypothetical protein J3F83DRAFT_529552 [Trichoderma novae-zelandiae]
MPHSVRVPRTCCPWTTVLTDPGISARGSGQGLRVDGCVLGARASPIEHSGPCCVSIVLRAMLEATPSGCMKHKLIRVREQAGRGSREDSWWMRYAAALRTGTGTGTRVGSHVMTISCEPPSFTAAPRWTASTGSPLLLHGTDATASKQPARRCEHMYGEVPCGSTGASSRQVSGTIASTLPTLCGTAVAGWLHVRPIRSS